MPFAPVRSRLSRARVVPVLACMALSLSTFCPLAALADDAQTQTEPQFQTESQTPSRPLQGGVEMSQAEVSAYNAAAVKLHSSAKMSSDDFHALQIGVTGIELTHFPDQDYSKVERVFEGLPAEAAGLKVGETVVDGDPATEWMKKKADAGVRPIWAFTGGRAGTTMTLTMLRHGVNVPVTITRMNIEDIPDAKMRKMFEDMARRLGPSGEGTAEVPQPGPHIPFLLRALGHL